jgi:hypothetical protein
MTLPMMKTLDPRRLATHDALITRSRRNEAPFARAARQLRSNHIERRYKAGTKRSERAGKSGRLKVRRAKSAPGSSCRTACPIGALPSRFMP